MRWLVVVAVVAGCTKPNPSASCADGKCTNAAYPYCDVDGAIGGTPNECIAVICTPGTFGACDGSDAALYCNAAGDGYDPMPCMFGCDASSDVCQTTCTANSQCPTGICKNDGMCALDAEIAYVDPAGSATSDCSKVSPCTLEHAAALAPPQDGQYIKLAPGTYKNTTTVTLSLKRTLVGSGAATTTIQSLDLGPIFTLDIGADITFEEITISSAQGRVQNAEPRGAGIYCPASPTGPRRLTVLDAVLSDNQDAGVLAEFCETTIRRSVFRGNHDGAVLIGTPTVDACLFDSNTIDGLVVNGPFTVTNSFIFRSQGTGVTLEAAGSSRFDFNTVADNPQLGVNCTAPGIIANNNLIVRNGENVMNDANSPCTYPGSIIAADVAGLNFRSPDTAPYDYHLTAGSIAIDAAAAATLDHDFDGDPRPKGLGRDVGADEAQ